MYQTDKITIKEIALVAGVSETCVQENVNALKRMKRGK
jgi:hypothetical protein